MRLSGCEDLLIRSVGRVASLREGQRRFLLRLSWCGADQQCPDIRCTLLEANFRKCPRCPVQFVMPKPLLGRTRGFSIQEGVCEGGGMRLLHELLLLSHCSGVALFVLTFLKANFSLLSSSSQGHWNNNFCKLF